MFLTWHRGSQPLQRRNYPTIVVFVSTYTYNGWACSSGYGLRVSPNFSFWGVRVLQAWTDANGNTMMLRSFVSKLFQKTFLAEGTLVPLLWRKRNKYVWFFIFIYLFTRLHAAQFAFWRWKLSTRWSQTAHATIDLWYRHIINPRPTRFVSGMSINSDDTGLEDIKCVRGLGG